MQPDGIAPTLIVAGPTCSGKSALALHLAERLNGTVINADSMQVYRELQILTARPSLEDEARVSHVLYGVRSAAQPGSAAWWRDAAADAIGAARAAGRLPILCGGTGLYLATLTQGIAPIPDPGDAARAEARAILARDGAAAMHAALVRIDPETAATLPPGDGQRIARAWEVVRGTGRGLADWTRETPPPPAGEFRMILLDPPRPELREAIATRFAAMLDQGAITEVEALLALGLDPALPAMRAHGVAELAAYVRGEITLEQASRRAILASQQYTKRQATWFRHRAPVPENRTHTIHARFAGLEQFSERQMQSIERFISGNG